MERRACKGNAGEMPKLSVEKRIDFSLLELRYNDELAKKEVSRSLQCDLRLYINPVILPPEHMLTFTEENVQNVPDCEGAFILYDKNKQIYMIKGSMTLKDNLIAQLGNETAKYFVIEEDPMYTKKESELIQSYLWVHGSLPPGNTDDLF
jgi:hypothetical protein